MFDVRYYGILKWSEDIAITISSRYLMYGTTVYYKWSEDIALTVTSRYSMYSILYLQLVLGT